MADVYIKSPKHIKLTILNSITCNLGIKQYEKKIKLVEIMVNGAVVIIEIADKFSFIKC